MNRISILNKKGGVGKTPLAITLAKDLEYYLITNDDSVVEEAYAKYSKIQKEPVLMNECVYDFGGFVNDSMLHVIENRTAKESLVNLSSIVIVFSSKENLRVCRVGL